MVIQGFKVELGTSEEQALLVWAGYIGGNHVYDVLVEKHVGVDLMSNLQWDCEHSHWSSHYRGLEK